MSFHVPEARRVVKNHPRATPRHYGNNGAFVLEAVIPGRKLWTIASDGLGWEHVSVSLLEHPTKTPTWAEMEHVRLLFWDAEDVVVQIHARRSEWVSHHPGCLHLWRPIGVDLPTPHKLMVGPESKELA